MIDLKQTGLAKQTGLSGYGCEDVDLRGFVSLMDLYENNYLRLRRLMPDLSKLPESTISDLPGCLRLHLNILEQTKFTSTIFLSYYFEEGEQVIAEPALTLRVYHDANQVEVLTGHLQHGRQRYDHILEKAIKIKWKLNRFLYKWLGYCLYLGHEFSPQDLSALNVLKCDSDGLPVKPSKAENNFTNITCLSTPNKV